MLIKKRVFIFIRILCAQLKMREWICANISFWICVLQLSGDYRIELQLNFLRLPLPLPPHPESAPCQVLGAIGLVNVVTWPRNWCVMWFCGCGTLILSHHTAKFGIHRPCGSRGNDVSNISSNSNSKFNSKFNSNAEVPMLRFTNGHFHIHSSISIFQELKLKNWSFSSCYLQFINSIYLR